MPNAKSYLGFPCDNCRTPIRAFTITVETPTPKITTPGDIRLACPECGHDGEYATQRLTRFEESQMH